MSDLVGNEYNFMQYSEKIVHSLQKALRAQQNLHDLPVIEIALKVEEIVYNQAIKNCGLQNVERVWDRLESVRWYQAKCEKITKNAQLREFHVAHVESGNANAVLQELFRDDYTAPKQPKPRVKSASSAGVGTVKAKNSKKGGATIAGVPNLQLQQQQQLLLQEQYNFMATLQPPPLISTFSLPTPHFVPKLANDSGSSPPPLHGSSDNDDGLDFLQDLEDSNFSADMNWVPPDMLLSPAVKESGHIESVAAGTEYIVSSTADVPTPSLQQKREQERAERDAIKQTVHFGDDNGDGGELLDLMDF